MAKEHTYQGCRYGDNVHNLFGSWNVIKDKSRQDYPGNVTVLFKQDGHYAYVDFEYGSCSGCDSWESEGLNDKQIEDEIIKNSLFFENKTQLDIYIANGGQIGCDS